ncbi:MAG: M50 family metallopeptidase [Patescibacteria group bacterium]|nr:M50 family metallopeptidase [Patescibacteria group bacterium]
MNVLAFFIILAVLVLIHEFGHFIAAKRMGIKVEEFGFGFPPRVFGKKIGETLYSYNLLPIGGFVKVYGEEYHEDEGKIDKARAFIYKKPWQKSIVLLAGVFMNFILGWFLISYLFTQGIPTPTANATISDVSPNSPAAAAGLRQGDEILRILAGTDTIQIDTAADLVAAAKQYGDTPITLEYERDGQIATTVLTPRANPPAGQGAIGVVIMNYEIKQYPWYTAPYYGLRHAAIITVTILRELGNLLLSLVTFQETKVDITGPVGIAQYTGEALKYGPNALLELTALLSLNLAVVNLLPFPALDGGRLVFVLYEWITRKRISQNFERNLNLFGIITLLSLSIIVTYFDIVKLFQ